MTETPSATLPEDPFAAHLRAGADLVERDRLEPAVGELERAIAENPHSDEAHRMMALARLGLKQIDGARTAAERAVALNPSEAGNHFILGLVQSERRQFLRAERCFLEALRRRPVEPEFWGAYAGALVACKQFARAERLLRQGLALDPKNAALHHNLGYVLEQLGRPWESTAQYRDAIGQDPNLPESHINLGVRLLSQNEIEPARREFLEALRLDPGHRVAQENLARCVKARNRFYGFFWRLNLRLSRLSRQGQIAFIFGLYLMVNLLFRAAALWPALAPYVNPIVAVYGGFVLYTWVADPVGNWLIRREFTR